MGLSVSRWRLAEGAARLRPAARAAIGGLRSAAGRPARVAGLHAGQRREPGSLGRAVERSVLPRAARPEFAIGRNRRLRRAGAGDRDGLSPCPTPALLGAQGAQHFGEGPAARRSAGQGRGSENLLGEERRNCATRLRTISVSLALALSRHGSATGTRSARAAALLRSAATLVAESAHHQCHRTLLRRGPPPDAAHGRLHQRRKRGPNHLCDFQSFQPGLENPHPQPIYTSSLTSPCGGKDRMLARAIGAAYPGECAGQLSQLASARDCALWRPARKSEQPSLYVEETMATKTSEPSAQTRNRGGAFLIANCAPNDVFTPADLTDDQKLIGQTAEEFVAKEVL